MTQNFLVWLRFTVPCLFIFLLFPGTLRAGDQEIPSLPALSKEMVEGLQNGKGMEMAKAAEMNHYPGPSHVLELSGKLALSPEQESKTRALFENMKRDAMVLGRELLAEEGKLNQLFANRQITPGALHEALGRISQIQGRLREVHLASHLEQALILTPEQIARYDTLRGYDAPAGVGQKPHHH